MKTDLNDLKDARGVVLVEFYATWCPHCQRMMPVVADVEALLQHEAEVYQLDIDKNQEPASKLGVDGIPAFIVFKDGEEVWRGSGEMEANVLLQKVQEAL